MKYVGKCGFVSERSPVRILSRANFNLLENI